MRCVLFGRKDMASELTLTVNGAKQVVSAAPETPLISCCAMN